MKNLKITLIASFIVLLFLNVVNAQQSTKAITKELKSRAIKEARKEARKYKKDGFYVAPGALVMDKQLEKAWIKQYEEDENGYPMYITATGNAVAETQTAAKLQANEMAKFELAGSIATNIAGLIESNIANAQLNNEEATSVTEVSAAAKNLIAQEIGRTVTLFEIYREVDKNNIEANVRVAYNSQKVEEAAKKIIREELKKKTEIQQDKLEKLMNF